MCAARANTHNNKYMISKKNYLFVEFERSAFEEVDEPN